MDGIRTAGGGHVGIGDRFVVLAEPSEQFAASFTGGHLVERAQIRCGIFLRLSGFSPLIAPPTPLREKGSLDGRVPAATIRRGFMLRVQ
jgi:hypothetical protein